MVIDMKKMSKAQREEQRSRIASLLEVPRLLKASLYFRLVEVIDPQTEADWGCVRKAMAAYDKAVAKEKSFLYKMDNEKYDKASQKRRARALSKKNAPPINRSAWIVKVLTRELKAPFSQSRVRINPSFASVFELLYDIASIDERLFIKRGYDTHTLYVYGCTGAEREAIKAYMNGRLKR